jgi:hypothetical protein
VSLPDGKAGKTQVTLVEASFDASFKKQRICSG